MALVGDGNGDSVDRQPIDGLVLQMRVERSSAENRWNDVVPLSPSKPAATATATTRTTTMATATATATTTTRYLHSVRSHKRRECRQQQQRQQQQQQQQRQQPRPLILFPRDFLVLRKLPAR
ncbi:hypothetical protein HZH66_001610 [Vespula vulgaris]|uniref:Uncharacterized protein n=1 Tax=Vespula vulgaris TaxID=7454 RepID=A0A834NLP1_VESVU|nr:hypothetical protein HZH66_001610 [Vespula vulgaris]